MLNFFFNVCWSESSFFPESYFRFSKFKILFQDPASPMMEGIIHLHHDIMIIMVVVVVFVGWALAQVIYQFSFWKTRLAGTTTHGTVLEIVWTVTPSVILIIIAIPTFALLYAMDEGVSPALTLKVLGHQWYWSYEYSDFSIYKLDSKPITYEFDCFLVAEADLVNPSQFRLLETDNIVCLPIDNHIRVLVTAVDVLHSWAIPALGVKMDACPGRLNQILIYINQKGTYYGQCSEICGANHAFMPIMLVGTGVSTFENWLESMYSKLF